MSGYQGIIPAISVTESNPGNIIVNTVNVTSNNTTIEINFIDGLPKEMYVITQPNNHTGMTFDTPDTNGITWVGYYAGGSFPGYNQSKTELWHFMKVSDELVIGRYVGVFS